MLENPLGTEVKIGQSPISMVHFPARHVGVPEGTFKGCSMATYVFSDGDLAGEVGEDPTATCEPFFVPRQPLFEDEATTVEVKRTEIFLWHVLYGRRLYVES